MDSTREETARLPADVYRQTAGAFVRFAEQPESQYAGLWREVIARAVPTDGLPDGDVVASEPVFLRDHTSLDRAFTPTSRTIWGADADGKSMALPNSPADELWRFAATLSEPARLALDVLLRRALNPVEALATWPLEALFEPEEVTWLRVAQRSAGALQPIRGTRLPTGDMDYRGYACAIVKFTRLCNLRCSYCHDWRAGPNNTMPFLVQANLFQKLLGSPNHRVVDVIWHGGEPTLIGRHAFLRVLALQRYFWRHGQQVRNRVQTNATTLDPPWVEFCKRYGLRVGVSLDGPPEIHNRTRPNVGGYPTFNRVRRGLRLLQEAGLLDHVYLVIGAELLALGAAAVVDFLQAEGITHVGMIPVVPGGGPMHPQDPYANRRDYVRFLLDVHRVRCERPEPWIHVREIDGALRAVRGELAGHCELLGNCIGTFFSIEPDGHVAHCDRYVGDPHYMLGNILHQDFDQLRSSQQAQHLVAQNRVALLTPQSACPYFVYCRGWCPHERYSAQRYNPAYEPRCCGLSELFAALREEVRCKAVSTFAP